MSGKRCIGGSLAAQRQQNLTVERLQGFQRGIFRSMAGIRFSTALRYRQNDFFLFLMHAAATHPIMTNNLCRDIYVSVQIPRQAREDRKKLGMTGRGLPIRAGRTGEEAGGFYEKNQQRGTLTASAISRLTEILRALNALMMVLIVRF